MIYTTELVASALKLAPLGDPYTGAPCTCAFCARPLKEGDMATVMRLPKTFTDFAYIGTSGQVCGFCAASTQSQDVMRRLQRSVITADGIYSLSGDQARAWLWLTPPSPPFAVVVSHSTLGCFHYFWRTPVTTNVDFIQVNVDGEVMQVRRQRVLKAIETANLLVLRVNQPGQKRALIASPFERLDRDVSNAPGGGHGRIRKEVRLLAKSDQACAAAIEYLSSLNAAELFALSPILKANPQPPVQPELISSLAEALQGALASSERAKAEKAEQAQARLRKMKEMSE